MVQEAVDIKALKDKSPLLPSDWGHYLDYSNYSYAINQSGVISVPVFDQQTICFNGAKLPESLEDGKVYAAAGGTIVLKKVKLPDNIKELRSSLRLFSILTAMPTTALVQSS